MPHFPASNVALHSLILRAVPEKKTIGGEEGKILVGVVSRMQFFVRGVVQLFFEGVVQVY